jgi:hypothetical protein
MMAVTAYSAGQPPSNDKGVSCLALRYAPGPNSLEPASVPRTYVVQPEPVWCLRYAGTKLALARSGTSSHSAVLAVESEQSL